MNHYIAVGIVLIVIVALMATNKKLVETLKNIYKIEELRKRILYTLWLFRVSTPTPWARGRHWPTR